MKTFVEEKFPYWAAYYAMYGEYDGMITDEDKAMVDKFMNENNLSDLVDIGECYFSAFPAFGKACDVGFATFLVKEV